MGLNKQESILCTVVALLIVSNIFTLGQWHKQAVKAKHFEQEEKKVWSVYEYCIDNGGILTAEERKQAWDRNSR